MHEHINPLGHHTRKRLGVKKTSSTLSLDKNLYMIMICPSRGVHK